MFKFEQIKGKQCQLLVSQSSKEKKKQKAGRDQNQLRIQESQIGHNSLFVSG